MLAGSVMFNIAALGVTSIWWITRTSGRKN
jgi:hypothetical protein